MNESKQKSVKSMPNLETRPLLIKLDQTKPISLYPEASLPDDPCYLTSLKRQLTDPKVVYLHLYFNRPPYVVPFTLL